jgi:hypothetical protein
MTDWLRLLLYLCLSWVVLPLTAQEAGVPLNSRTYHLIDRLEIITGQRAPIHTAIQYYNRKDVSQFALELDTMQLGLSKKDRLDLRYLFRDNNEWLNPAEGPTSLVSKKQPVYTFAFSDSSQTYYTRSENQAVASQESPHYERNEKPFLKHFYKTPANLFELDRPGFYIRLNPMLQFKAGALSNDEEYYFLNQRGVELRGGIDDRIFFYTNILESQARYPEYVRNFEQKFLAVPGAGFYKDYTSDVFNLTNGYDFLLAQGYLGFRASKHVGMQLGHGRNFIGHGYRSLLLSDFGNNYFYLKLNTQVWKLHYQNIFAELSVEGARDEAGSVLIPKKYMAAHYLSFDITPKMTVGIYEAVIFNRNNQFELQYLNPVIFYRVIEGFIGSPDNVLLGVNGRWNLAKRFQLYGQFLLDEFKFSEVSGQNGGGWWGNKYSIQVGAKYMNVLGVDHLDGQLEYNMSRPYTYAHRDSASNYSHYNQALAHPLGANFQEIIGRLQYQASEKLRFDARLIYQYYGEDDGELNWGSNILLPYDTRVMDYGNEIGQGITAKQAIASLDVSYELMHNTYLEFHYLYRKKSSEDPALDMTTQFIGGGLRMNIGLRRMEW